MKEYEIIFSVEFSAINSANDNLDVVVKVNGCSYSATFFTRSNIDLLMERYKHSKECLSGKYFWSSNMILIERLEELDIRQTIEDLFTTGEFYSAFGRDVD